VKISIEKLTSDINLYLIEIIDSIINIINDEKYVKDIILLLNTSANIVVSVLSSDNIFKSPILK
tara:strand:+ start:275 stop:466 length:192 start_codon:yes stop_codon:yes gene_type:complete